MRPKSKLASSGSIGPGERREAAFFAAGRLPLDAGFPAAGFTAITVAHLGHFTRPPAGGWAICSATAHFGHFTVNIGTALLTEQNERTSQKFNLSSPPIEALDLNVRRNAKLDASPRWCINELGTPNCFLLRWSTSERPPIRSMKPHHAAVLAGYAEKNASLMRRLGVPLGDPAAWIEIDSRRIGLVRDLEMDRVRAAGRVDEVTCPAEHPPGVGLSADRETATAEAATEILRTARIEEVRVDRSLPFIFAWHFQQAEIIVTYDHQLGVVDRRPKSDAELKFLADAQSITEDVMRWTCQRIAACDVGPDDAGNEDALIFDGDVLTSERVRAMVAIEFLKRGCTMSHGAIIATAPQVADCHHSGSGNLYSGRPIIVDLFPRDERSRYWGDCTRTVVHGNVSEVTRKMHAAVVEAKAAASAMLITGNTADQVHKAAESTLVRHGYPISRGTPTDGPSIQHGTGHGIGLDLHEPILLDHGGGEMLEHEVFTIEPGLYGRDCGGVRIEDMLVVMKDHPRNLNSLPEALTWN